jgi:hypothetical protein
MTMLVDAVQISESEMLRAWAIAEASNKQRWGARWTLGTHLARKLAQEETPELTEEEWTELERGITRVRSPLLAGLLPLHCEWLRGTLAIDDVAQLEMMNWPEFVNVARSRKLADLLPAIREARIPGQEEFTAGVIRLSSEFDLARMRGH